jgi:hypothetical protein
MTEAEWLAETDLTAMLDFIRDGASHRKMILFGCCCCRWIWHLMPDDHCKRAVEVAEFHADGLATVEEWRTASKAAEPAIVTARTDAVSKLLLQRANHQSPL